MTHLNGPTMQFGIGGTWSRNQDTLQQLWADSEPTMSKKTTPSHEIQTNDVLRAVAAIQHLPSPTPPDSPFLSALGTSAALKGPTTN